MVLAKPTKAAGKTPFTGRFKRASLPLFLIILQAARTGPLCAEPKKDYTNMHRKIVQKATDQLSKLQASSVQLEQEIDASVSQLQGYAELLASFVGCKGIEDEESVAKGDNTKMESRLADLRHRLQDCEGQQRTMQALIHGHQAHLSTCTSDDGYGSK